MTGQSYKRNPSVTPTCTAPPPPHTHTHSLFVLCRSLHSAVNRLPGGGRIRSSQLLLQHHRRLFQVPAAADETLRLCKLFDVKAQRDVSRIRLRSRSLPPSAKAHLAPLNPTETSKPGPPGDPCHQPVKSKSHILFIQDPSGGWGEGGGRWGRSMQQQADQSQSCPPKRTDTHQTGRSALLHA